jgi:hypothetical protein
MKNYLFYKSLLLFSILVLALSGNGCYDSGDDDVEIPKIAFNPDSGPGITRTLQPDDPNMDKNWDWTVDKWYSINNSTTLIQLPYFSSGSGSEVAMACKDYLPADGWILLCKNFGDKEPLTSPFFILYNKPKGIIRLFFIYTGDYASYAIVRLKSFAEVKTSIFTFGQDEFSYNDNYDQLKNSAGNPVWNGLKTMTEVIPKKWSIADFVVSYDPELKDDTELMFTISMVDESKLTIEGRSIVEQITHQEKANFGLFDYAKTAFTILSTGKEAYDKIKNKTNKAASLSVEDYNISSDEKVNNKSISLGTACAVIVAAVKIGGTIKGVIDAKNAKTTVVDAEWTEYDLNGEIITSRVYDNFRMRMPGSKRINQGSYEPLNEDSLGVFSLKTKPKIGINKINSRRVTEILGNKYEYYECSMGLAEPLRIEANTISGYKIGQIQTSLIWLDNETNIKANGVFGDSNFKSPYDSFHQNGIFSEKSINVNKTFLNNIQFKNKLYDDWVYKEKKISIDSYPKLKQCKIVIIVTLIPDGTDPKIPAGSDEIKILRTFTPTTIESDYTKEYDSLINDLFRGTISLDQSNGTIITLDNVRFITLDKTEFQPQGVLSNKRIIIGNAKEELRKEYLGSKVILYGKKLPKSSIRTKYDYLNAYWIIE